MMKIIVACFDIINGFYSGYPVCCVLNYVRLRWADKCPAEHMSELFGTDDFEIQYVRCLRCRKRDHRVSAIRSGSIPDPRYLILKVKGII